MIKIFHVIDSGGFYGAEVMLVNLVEEQIKIGIQPLIASIGDLEVAEKAFEKESIKRGLPIKIFRMRPGLNFKGAMQLLQFCNDEDFDLIHSHGYKCNVLLGPLPISVRKIPMLSTVHGWTSTSGFTMMRIYEWLDALSLRFVDGVAIVNKGMLQNSKIARLKRKKLFIADNGIPAIPPDAKETEPLDEDILEFCKDSFVIGSIGRYSVEKGFDILLKSFCLIPHESQDGKPKLLLMGEGGQRKHYEKIIAENDLSDRVMLTGYRSDAWRYLKLMGVYVISSLTEGLPITLLEAMRGKVSVVATKVGGIPEVLKNGLGGSLVEPGNPNDLAKAISAQFYESDIVKKQIEYSFERFMKKYSSKRMSETYHSIYKRILQK